NLVAGRTLMAMETLILASLCVGAAAGVRLRVFVLFPLIFLCLAVVTAWGVAQNQTIWSITVMNFVGSACLQLGYLAGIVPSSSLLPRDKTDESARNRFAHLQDRRSV